jgi:transposase
MSVEFDTESLARRLVISRKRDGRNVYDPLAKRELIEACMQPGVSITRLARECGVNANQLSTWVRVHQRAAETTATTSAPLGEVVETCPAAFVPVHIHGAPHRPEHVSVTLDLQARLPNGVVVDLRGCEPQQMSAVLEVLGRMRCSASTKS